MHVTKGVHSVVHLVIMVISAVKSVLHDALVWCFERGWDVVLEI